VLLNVFIALLLLVTTTGIHAGMMMYSMHLAHHHHDEKRVKIFRVIKVSRIVILIFIASFLEVLVWAVAYLTVNAIDGLEKAVYFSMVTFTTLGYGDVLLDGKWRLLASFEAANGIIMFGWSTAILMSVVHRIYFVGNSQNS
jgi:hypothetical protein